MKLNLSELWEMQNLESASAHLESWYQWVASSDIGSSMKRLTNTIKAHATRILNYFPDHLTSGLMEGINSLINEKPCFRSSGEGQGQRLSQFPVPQNDHLPDCGKIGGKTLREDGYGGFPWLIQNIRITYDCSVIHVRLHADFVRAV